MTTNGAIAIAIAISLAAAGVIGHDAYKESQKVWPGKPCSASQLDESRQWGTDGVVYCVEGPEELPYFWKSW